MMEMNLTFDAYLEEVCGNAEMPTSQAYTHAYAGIGDVAFRNTRSISSCGCQMGRRRLACNHWFRAPRRWR